MTYPIIANKTKATLTFDVVYGNPNDPDFATLTLIPDEHEKTMPNLISLCLTKIEI